MPVLHRRVVHRRTVLAVLTAVAAVGSTGDLSAQSVDESVRRQVSNLADSALVRVIAPGVFVDPGRFLGVFGDSLRLADADVRLAVSFDELEELSVQRSQWLEAALTAAGVAAVFGGAAGYFLGTGDCDFQIDGCGRHQINGIVYYGGMAALAGGVVGAIVGSRHHEWRRIFP